MKNIQLIGSLLASSILAGCGGDSGGSDPAPAPVSHAPVINSITATEEYFIDDVVQLTVVVTDEDTPLEELSITYSTGSSEVVVTNEDQKVAVTVADDEHQTVDTIIVPAGVNNGNLDPIRSPYDHVETKVALFNAIAEQTDSEVVIETNEDGDYFVVVNEETYVLSDLTEEEVYELIDIINDGVKGAPNVRPIDGSPVTIPTITSITLDGGIELGAQVFVVVDAHDEDDDDLTVTYNGETSNEFAVGREDQLVKVNVTDGTYLVSQSITIPKAEEDEIIPTPIEPGVPPEAPVINSIELEGGVYLNDLVKVIVDVSAPEDSDLIITYNDKVSNEFTVLPEEQEVTVSIADGTYLISQSITIPKAVDDEFIPTPIDSTPAPIAPVIESITQSGGIYVGDKVTLSVVVTDEDTPLENITVTYSTPTGMGELARTDSDQVVTVSVQDGTYLIKQDITVVAGEPLPNTAPEIIKISAPDYVYANTVSTVIAEAVDEEEDPLSYQWTQTKGPDVSIVENSVTLTFIPPEVTELSTLEFMLTVRDEKGGVAEESIEIDLWVDTDGDGVPNHIDNDDDNDGVVDDDDLDPLDPLKNCIDGKAPSQDGYCSLDVDNDGIADKDQTIEVSDYLELKEALKYAAGNERNDFISLNAGTYHLDETLVVISDKNYGLYLSGNSRVDTVIDGNGHQIISFNYIVQSKTFVNVEIANIAFKNGVVNKDGSNQVHSGYGGAIYASVGTNLTIKDSAFYNNRAEVNGGAVYADSFFTSINNHFEFNVAGNDGGAVWANYNTSVKNTTFVANEAVRGGGFYNYQSWTPTGYKSSVIDKSVFTKNKATNSGGGLYMNSGGSSHPVLINNSKFIENNAVSGNNSGIGGGFYANVFNLSDSIVDFNIVDGRGAGFSSYHGSSESNVSRSIIKNNTNTNVDDSSTLDCGGGFYIRYGSIDNTIITSNVAKNGGGFCAQYGIELMNSIVKDNSSGISIDSHSNETPVVMTNNIIIDNIGYEIYDMDTTYGSPMLILKNNFLDTSDISLLFMDENNIFQGVNPSFVDVDDYHLKSDSHLIDVGCKTCVNHNRDLDNEIRVYGSRIDIGPYEYRP